jgi:AraC-like DNA-binding protein
MARAKELLRYSPMLLDEISEQCGFANTGYFIKSFKKACRVSPGAFRNKHSVSNLKK